MVFRIITITLILLIFACGMVGTNYGSCYEKQCHDFRTVQECNNEKIDSECAWQNGYCAEETCGMFWNNRTACTENAERLNCTWYKDYCADDICSIHWNDEGGCNNVSARLNCTWIPFEDKTYATGECRSGNDEMARAPGVKADYLYDNKCEAYNDKRTSCVMHENECKWQPGRSYYGRSKTQDLPISVLVIWILTNIVFIALILLIVAYGTIIGNESLINIGIIFFSVDVISRYIGFIMDFSGYNTMAVIFITGGTLLLLGGWLIEKWRRNMIQKARKNN